MKGRFTAGILALLLGIIGAQKFYLGRKKEGIFMIIISFTGIPALLGIFEGIWMISRTDLQWKAYLDILEKPKWYMEPSIQKLYLYPIGLSAFVFSFARNEHSLFRFAGLVLLLAIWLYPMKDEGILENRLARAKSHPWRVISSILVIIMGVTTIAQGGIKIPSLRILSQTNTTQTGGLYELRIHADPATKVLVNSLNAELMENNEYKAFVSIENRTTMIRIHAENQGKTIDQEIMITRALSEKELAELEVAKKETETRRLAVEKEKADSLKRQQEEDAKCMKNAKCRKEKEESKKLADMIEKDAKLTEWIKLNGTKAWSYCKQVMEGKLKSPSTADFPWGADNTWAAGGYVYVMSHVDSQNGFGAMIRSQFTCKLDVREDDTYLVDFSAE